MNISALLSCIDHTALSPITKESDIIKLCNEAKDRMASVCVPPCYVKLAKKCMADSDTPVCTVIGFPLGYNSTAVKTVEAIQAIKDGATEIDMVINIGQLKSGNYSYVLKEIIHIKESIGNHILKVIVETCYLTYDEKVKLCDLVTLAEAEYIKTSTGFGNSGANIEDIRIFKEHIGQKVQIKASGGIKTRDDVEMFLELGCDRIGTSSAMSMIQ